MVVLQHEHSLSLVDLNPKYPHDEEVYDDEEDLIIKQAFQCPCARCKQEITYLHRYYYTCDHCDYSLHKLCEQIPTKLQHASHVAHSLTLFLADSQEQCHMCKHTPRYTPLRYHCSRCVFNICLDCAMDEVQYHTIYHPSHQHPLIPVCRQRETLTECDACGKEHKGVFYECSTCFRSLIHNSCVFCPKRLLIQDGTSGRFSHSHPLILAYSFPKVEQKTKFYPTCRVCDNIFYNENVWVYKCEKCRYYAHADCANSICEPSNSNYESHGDSGAEEYQGSLHVLNFPLPDPTYNIFTYLLSKENNYETSITHNSHEHPLILVDLRSNDATTKMYYCNGCGGSILNMQIYKCTYGCKFFLHVWCTRLPTEYKVHDDTFILLMKVDTVEKFSHLKGYFRCLWCRKFQYGFSYYCAEKDSYLDVSCALITKGIKHKSHPYHTLFRVYRRLDNGYCRICLSSFKYSTETSLSCKYCNFHLHPECALLLPDTIRHRYDKHPMTLTYSPVEDHEGDYFCEVCEEELNPNASFYHCHECVQSIHITCAPLVPQIKSYIHGLQVKGFHEIYVDIQFFILARKAVAATTK